MINSGRKQYGSKPAEQKVVDLIKRLARARKGGAVPGHSQIARELNDKGYRTQANCFWTAQGVKNILQRKPIRKRRYTKKQSLGPNDYLTPTEVGRALVELEAKGDDFMMIIFLLGINTGLRVSEMCNVQVRDLPKGPDRHQLWVRKAKRFKQRSVAVDYRFTEKVQAYKDRHLKATNRTDFFLGVSTKTVQRKVKKIGEMTGKPELHPHALRHTFGTLLYHYTKDLILAKEQMGHTSIKSTEIYINVLSESRKEHIEQFGDCLEATWASALFGRSRRIDVKGQGFIKFTKDKDLKTE